MITPQELRKIARERRLPLDLVEKDYALGWVIIGLSSSDLKDTLIFKGGTSLSKVHFPLGWRISEDLDFTLAEGASLKDVGKKLVKIPGIVGEVSGGLSLIFRDEPYTNPGFLRVRAQYTGPISRNAVKIEVSCESFIGDVERISVQRTYDYPEYSVLTYTVNNILAEKLRAMIERGAVRDYYDAWRLMKTDRVDLKRIRQLFLKKCEGKGIVFQGTSQFFPEGLTETLEPYLKTSLARLLSEPFLQMEKMLADLKNDVSVIFD